MNDIHSPAYERASRELDFLHGYLGQYKVATVDQYFEGVTLTPPEKAIVDLYKGWSLDRFMYEVSQATSKEQIYKNYERLSTIERRGINHLGILFHLYASL